MVLLAVMPALAAGMAEPAYLTVCSKVNWAVEAVDLQKDPGAGLTCG